MSYTHSSTTAKVVIGAAHSRGYARSMAARSMAEAFGPHARLTLERAERNADRIVGWCCAIAAAAVAIGLLTGLIP